MLLAATLGCSGLLAAAAPQQPLHLDLAADTSRQVVVDRQPGQYLGHVSTVLLEDGRTILAVYPKGHGRGAIVLKRSRDGGRTWSERLPVPDSWASSREVPTIHRVVDAAGTRRLILWSGLYPARLAVSEDDGASWSELEPAGDWGGIVVMGDVAATRTPGRYLAWFHDDGRFRRADGARGDAFELLQVESTDGGLTWSEPRTLWRGSDVHLCEPGSVRSPGGDELLLLLRENARRQPSHAMASRDEGATWSDPAPLHPALCGDRHTLRYAPDGRLVCVFRDMALDDGGTKGDFVAWVGRYEDLRAGRGGQYRVRLLDNHDRWDCGYPGLEVLEDGTFVATTYGHWDAGQEPYIVSVRLRLDELDRLAAEPKQAKQPQRQPRQPRRQQDGPRRAGRPLDHAALAAALTTLEAYRPTRTAPDDAEVVAAERALRRAIPDLVFDDGPVTQRLLQLLAARRDRLVPTPQQRIAARDPLARVLVRFDDEHTRQQPPAAVRPHPAAAAFPGAVPESAVPTDAVLAIDLRTPGRHSLGLYAAPGARVEVRFGDGVAPPPAGLAVRIGAHSDDIARRPSWPRMPRISRRFAVATGAVTAANAYGGLVYVEVGRDTAAALPAGVPAELPVAVRGAVPAPRFRLGRTSAEDWRSRLRELPGPWAELETDKVVLTVPSARVRGIDDPTELLRFWDQLLDAAADLATIPRDRPRPERYVADVEISAGAMHAGYPIMTHLNAVADMVTLSRLQGGSWGLFHELGHNHQQRDWTFAGTGEVTCNLFSLYLCEVLCGVPWDAAWNGNLARAHQRLAAHVEAGTKPWQATNVRGGADLALRLLMYSQIQRGFGWEAFGHTFAEYRDLPDEQRPQTDQDRRDQWLVRLSRAVSRDLGPFFAAWGVEVSQQARAEVADLVDWWPDDWPQRSSLPVQDSGRRP